MIADVLFDRSAIYGVDVVLFYVNDARLLGRFQPFLDRFFVGFVFLVGASEGREVFIGDIACFFSTQGDLRIAVRLRVQMEADANGQSGDDRRSGLPVSGKQGLSVHLSTLSCSRMR